MKRRRKTNKRHPLAPPPHNYRCFDCKETQHIHDLAWTRAARPKCRYCGSIALDAIGNPFAQFEKERAHQP